MTASKRNANPARSPSSPSLAELATNKIRDRILDLTLYPGMQLDETILRLRLGISRTPAREALNRLMTEGLVEARAKRGFVVRPLDLGDIAKFFDAYVISERSIGLLCRFRHANLIEDLTAIQARLEAAAEVDDFLGISKHNAALHIRLAEATDNHYIIDAASRLHNVGRRLSFFVYYNEADEYANFIEQQKSINEEHHIIIDAIARGERTDLINNLTAHAERFRMRIRRFMTGRPLREFELIVDPGQNLGEDP